ncbi:MAG: extracellular solute-binding protein [Blastochloris sp.]|nr:extracellular solute-binding protein [Blastochloris sp.]
MFGSHTDVRKAVGAGELTLGFVNHYYYYLSKAEGAPVGIVWPDQGDSEMGLVVNSTNIGIVKGTEDLELAQVFVDFMLSPEGQQVYAEGNYEWPIIEGIVLAEGVEAPDSLNVADIALKTLHDQLPSAQEIAQSVGLP